MSWNTFHRRGDTLRAVVETANARRDGVLPMDLPGVVENFADELDLLGALQLKWHARLSGNVERALMRQPMDLESAVSAAWRTTAEEMVGVRQVIDRCAEEPTSPEMSLATVRATRLERARLAMAAGLASNPSDAAVEVGRRIEERAREELAPRVREPQAPATQAAGAGADAAEAPVGSGTGTATPGRHLANESFVDRIKAALTAA
jgi:hypothetical protein